MLKLMLAAALVVSDSLLVTAQWLHANLDRPDVVVLHVASDRTEYTRGHVPGARFADVMRFHGHDRSDQLLPVDRLVAAVEAVGVSNAHRVVLMGSPMSTALVFVALDYLGHGHRTSVLDGGLAAWRAAGGSLSTTAGAAVEPVRFVPQVRHDMVVTAAWLSQRLESSQVLLLDARSRSEYDGDSDLGGLSRPGHIPRARHLDWLGTLAASGNAGGAGGPGNDHADARLVPYAQLARLFQGAGAEPGRQVVTYCTVGMRASHLYFVARLLGFEAKLYVGSMADWDSRGLPVSRRRYEPL